MVCLTLAFAVPLALLPSVLARTSKTADPYTAFKAKLSKDQRILHALDRLTFGPRPGDYERVRKIGLKKWIDAQLHPERIAENPVLESKLKPLQSLTLSEDAIARAYPTPAMIAAIGMGRQPMPEDPILQSAVELYKERVALKKKEDGAPPRPAAADILAKLETVFGAQGVATLRKGPAEEKRALLASIPPDKQDEFVLAVAGRPAMRGQLFNLAPIALQRKILMASAPAQVIAYDLDAGKLYRAIYSQRQLQEELVDFWYNHFNVFLDKGNDRYMVPSYERDVIRPRVLGKFRDLLEATAKSPAMLFYLDNWQSVAPASQQRMRPARNGKPAPKRAVRGLNENYGRELMELHTLGVDGGYTQKDVIEVARCFTGWTIRNPGQGGTFFYNDRVHDKGEKTVLGVKIPAGGGMEDGEKVLDILAHHPSTAKFISTNLAKRFVADNPPPALIESMAKTFTATDGDLRAVMKTMLDSKEFWSAGAYRAKVKTPFEMIASAVRALNGDVDLPQPLAAQVARLGEPLYRKVEPTGYSSANAEWVNSAALLGRMNFALQLAQNKFPGVRVDAPDISRGKGSESDRIARALLFTEPTPATREALDKALAAQTSPNKTAPPGLIAGLVIGSPDFQRR